MSVIYLFLLLLRGCLHANSAHPVSCPPTQFSCGNYTWNVSSPFFTNSATNPGCRKVHCIYCETDSPVVRFYNTGFLYVVRDYSPQNRTIVVHDLFLNSFYWDSDCVFLYNFKKPTPAINLTQLTLSTKKALTNSFSCDKIDSDYNQNIFGDSLGHVSCKNYTLFLPQNSQNYQENDLPTYCLSLSSGGLWFTWKLSFGGDYEGSNDGNISLLSGGFSHNWDLHPDCFGCNVTAGSSCTTRGDPGDLDSPCKCIKKCRGRRKREKWVIVGASGGAAAGLLISILCIFLCKRRRTKNHSPSSIHLVRDSLFETHYVDTQLSSADYKTHIFSYAELDEATDGFSPSQELGDGGFGTVYKGKLRDGRIVAVKRLYENNYKRVEQFMNEVDILSPLRHQNLVSLYGCTSRHCRELLLVYEFVPNGTVADHLHGPRACERVLTWPIRMQIAIETAEALGYLHAIEPPIMHRDVKTNNILLDAGFHVKLTEKV
uniref:Protein kinase domain-containing protein n=1 Tax=Ananas comosus var. bracteatus TaxID=296719 RepID=A0A6V7PV32_ANACO|nr:unnamed protein product [Ananas comosus var. bracteatus]